MTSRLLPCIHCHRHIRVTETGCPFCRTSSLKVHATALMAGVALLAGCGSKPEEKPTPKPTELQPTPVKPKSEPASTPATNPGATLAPESTPVKPLPKPEPERETKDIYGGPPPPAYDSPAKIYGAPPIKDSPRVPKK